MSNTLRDQLIGAWKLVSYAEKPVDGSAPFYPMSEKPMGIKDAGAISETTDLKKQRQQFARLSTNMITLAKAVKLGTRPAYETYCPMKKASWLSDSID